ncbi:LytR/AlgR family response regulator transcription factor [Alloscardovia criceti]|uniref:LytR/AlgR family response regulator transcription factor n=1 Tax=Alloscardovia criceti TaxID=356828 RepID=UPI0003615095|nr:LytR domain-containing response regulator [Alloscardovia criceti]
MRVAIIDDVAHEAQQTRELVLSCDGKCQIDMFDSGTQFVEYILGTAQVSTASASATHSSRTANLAQASIQNYDVLFLDIEMPGLDGIETARKIREFSSEIIIIFTTRMAQYAVAGYTVDAAGYLVKPITAESFSLVWRKITRIVQSRSSTQIALETTDGTVFVDTADIHFVEVRSHMLYYHTPARVYTAWKSLTVAAQELKDHSFAAISRYALINLAHVSKFDNSTGDIEVAGHLLHVSRSKKREIAERLLEFHSRA